MGACFPGSTPRAATGPRAGNAPRRWREELFAGLPNLELILVIGQYAQAWHLGPLEGRAHRHGAALARDPGRAAAGPRVLPLPHPSWRNSGWLKANPWFEAELLPVLKAEVAGAWRRDEGGRR